MKFLVVWWYNYNKKYHMVLVIRFLDKVILKCWNNRERWEK